MGSLQVMTSVPSILFFDNPHPSQAFYFHQRIMNLNMEVFLGTKQQDGTTVSLLGPDRRKHMAIFGKSGVGKTTLMRNMIVTDIEAGNGVTVVDPHGSLIADLLEAIPRKVINAQRLEKVKIPMNYQ